MSDHSYVRIARAIGFLRANRGEHPALGELAAHLGLSASRTQRLFSRWAGVSPKRFQQFLTVEHVKQRMRQTGDLLSLSFESGLSGAGRLHDLFVNMEAMSPGQYRAAGAGLTIRHGTSDTPFGEAWVAYTGRGICRLSFAEAASPDGDRQALQRLWPEASFEADPVGAATLLDRVFSRPPGEAQRGLSLWVSGTNFQIQVWRALLRVPLGGLLSYGQLAGLAGHPYAARAVGSAMACNPVAFLIPCHRVLRESGDFGVYRWGGERKVAICAWEAAAGAPD